MTLHAERDRKNDENINYLECVKQPKFKNEQEEPLKMYLRIHDFNLFFFTFNQYSTLSPLLTPPHCPHRERGVWGYK